MSAEYRRVLHAWARQHLPEELRDKTITGVDVEIDRGRQWSVHTVEDPTFMIVVMYLDDDGTEERHTAWPEFDKGSVAMSTLLRELFAIAEKEEQP